MSTLDDWTTALSTQLSLDLPEESQKTVLNLARVVAHTVDRPAAPMTAFLVGVAVGQGQSVQEVAEKVRSLARSWASTP